MSQFATMQSGVSSSSPVTFEALTEALHRLRTDQLRDVWQFVQFLDYQAKLEEDQSDDAALWVAVQAHEAYKAQHPDEQSETYQTKESFMKALADL